MDYVGIDLGASAISTTPSSAVAIMDDEGRLKQTPRHFRRAAELAEMLVDISREQMIVAVDAPRSVPDWTRENYARRTCETELQKHSREHVGAFYGVAALFLRWYEIERRYFQGVKVIETYPRAVWARLGVPHKPKEFKSKIKGPEICVAIQRLVNVDCGGFTSHQVDSVLCAYTAWCYGRSQVEWHGRPGEGLMVLPAPGSPGRPPPDAEVVAEGFRRFNSQQG